MGIYRGSVPFFPTKNQEVKPVGRITSGFQESVKDLGNMWGIVLGLPTPELT